MEQPTLVNLVKLQSAFEVDGILFSEEGLREGEPGPFEEHMTHIDGQIRNGLRNPNYFQRFIEYNWNGFYHQQPWTEDKIPFDPTLTNVIVPETGDLIQVRGEGRKILLTFPPLYSGRMPSYTIVCASEAQVPEIRFIDPNFGSPFKGIEKVFSEEGFRSFPKLEDYHSLGILCQDKQLVVVPSTCREFL